MIAIIISIMCKAVHNLFYWHRSKKIVKILKLVGLPIIGIFLLELGTASAGSSANLSRSYQSLTSIPNGSIVSIDPTHQGYVEPANSSNGAHIIGVALPTSQSLLAVNPANGTVQVAISGNVDTLVSTANGPIKTGDQVSVSPFGGIGMEAPAGSRVIGIAQTSFNTDSSDANLETVKDKSGKSQQIYVGFIKLSIAIGSAGTAGNGGTGGQSQLDFLQEIIKSITGRTISTVRILLSIFIALITLVSLTIIIHASVYGTIISIGRNPLAQAAVYRALISVMLMTIVTVSIACVAIYYLLT